MTVSNLQQENYSFHNLSQEVNAIKASLGKKSRRYDAFFLTTKNGDYTSVYGMYGIIPYLSKPIIKIL